ncbi:hypothetical protein BKA63DRAFT_557685 [Paraphoma chrysanthemicola]|nr:hypothetical protein BKA63DRAFT_557685 [Paraphoma chrysanthemicola]
MATLEDRVAKVFENAIDTFERTFSDEEKTTFANFRSVDQMTDFVTAESRKRPTFKDGPVQQFCCATSRLSASLEPYFVIISTFVQSDPRIAGLIWGSLLFIFRLSEHHASFMVRLSEVFTRIADELKVFSRHVDSLEQAARERAMNISCPTNSRLTEAISNVYVDLVEFCQQVRQLLSGTRLRHRLRVTVNMMWKPFDAHFAGVLTKIRHHKELLQLELAATSTEELLAQYKKVQAIIVDMEESVNKPTNEQHGSKGDIARMNLTALKFWLNAPQWEAPLEMAISKRFKNTVGWYLNSLAFQDWCGEIQTLDDATASLPPVTMRAGRLILLQAKPGYGKTVLCAAIVEHCRPKPVLQPNFGLHDDAVDHIPPALTFYFFDKQAQSDATSSSAFRAIAAQLLHEYQDDHRTIDSAILLKNGTGSGQTTASESEVRALIKLYLHQRPGTSIIIDGVDECSEYENFLQQLSDIVAGTGCRIFLSCRPIVSIHGCFQGYDVVTTHLQNEENMQDIQAYVRKGILGLVMEQKLDVSDSSEDIVSEICTKSRSMFLWASLMMAYLKSDFLTPEDRHDAIAELNTFEDLENMYLRILQSIRRQCKAEKAWNNVQRLFYWVLLSTRPLQVAELQTAFAIRIVKPVCQRNLIPAFDAVLTKMSGALIEVTGDGTVRIIHLSVLEFLTQPRPHNENPLEIEASTANYILGLDCMSYLMHSVPGEPLSGSAHEKTRPSSLLKQHPLLLYSADYWALHSHEALKSRDESKFEFEGLRQKLLEMISDFLSNKNTITVWTEAAWTFGSAPQLHNLESQVDETMTVFAEDLVRLTNNWGTTLLSNPNEIWKSSIPAFMKSRFWVCCSETSIISLASKVNALPSEHGADVRKEPITIASQLSPDGTEVGVIKIWPSRSFSELPASKMTTEDVIRCSTGWRLNYTIASITTQQNVLSMTFDIPTENIHMALQRAFRVGQPKEFQVPVCFSTDLRQIGVLGCVVRTVPSSGPLNITGHGYHSQNIISLVVPTDHNTEHKIPVFSDTIDYFQSTQYTPREYDWYGMRFSPDARHLLIVRGRMAPGVMHLASAFDAIYQLLLLSDDSPVGEQPNFQYLAEYATRTTTSMKENFVFHPFESVLAISRVGNVVLWFFAAQLPVCGTYLHGVGIETLRGLIIPLHTALGWTVAPQSYALTHSMLGSFSSRRGTSAAAHLKALAYHQLDTRAYESVALPAGRAVASHRNGKSDTLMLKQYTAGSNSITIQHIPDNGIAREHDLVLLPKDTTFQGAHTTLLPSSVSANLGTPSRSVFGLVINKAEQDVYSVNESPELQLPLLMTRSVDLIPAVVGKRSNRSLEDDVEEPSTSKRLRP